MAIMKSLIQIVYDKKFPTFANIILTGIPIETFPNGGVTLTLNPKDAKELSESLHNYCVECAEHSKINEHFENENPKKDTS